MDSKYYLGLFLDEGRERLQQLGELLLALERAPEDRALVNDIFRTVHTFKGMADTMGFEDLAVLTHAMEEVLDGLRRGALAVEPGLVRLMLRCLDALEARIDDMEGNRPGTVPNELNVELASVLEKVIRVAPPPPRPAETSEGNYGRRPVSEHSRTYRVEISLDSSCFMKSARALMITSTLETLGAVVDITPSLEELEWSETSDSFNILVLTDATPAAIAASLLDIGEIASSSVTEHVAASLPPGARDLALDPRDAARLTELVGQGAEALCVQVTLMPGSRMKAVRAHLVLGALAGHGEAIALDPAIAALEADGAPDSFRVLFAARAAHGELREALMNIAEVLTVAIVPFEDMQVVAPAVAEEPPEIHEALESSEAAEGTIDAAARRPRTVRVATEHLDRLMALTDDLCDRMDGPADEAGWQDAAQLAATLRQELLRLRLTPLETVFNRFPRMVRDLAHDLGKQVQLIVSGQELQVDRQLVDGLGDLLVHLLRNALDHGLETPGERVARGKGVMGTLQLAARLDGADVLVTVADDGRGIDPEKVVATAIARGHLTQRAAAALTPRTALDLIFIPGVSTAMETTRLSGRGVGLDVVKSKVNSLGGSLEVETSAGTGSYFVLRFPLPADHPALYERVAARTPRVSRLDGSINGQHEFSA